MGRHQSRLLRYALAHPVGWHPYGTDEPTFRAVRALAQVAAIEIHPVNRAFRLALAPSAREAIERCDADQVAAEPAA